MDPEFGGKEALYWKKFSSAKLAKKFDDNLGTGDYYWARWPASFPDNRIFDTDKEPTFTDSV